MNKEQRKEFIEIQLANLHDAIDELKQNIKVIKNVSEKHINSDQWEQKMNVRLECIRNDHQFWVNTLNSDINLYFNTF